MSPFRMCVSMFLFMFATIGFAQTKAPTPTTTPEVHNIPMTPSPELWSKAEKVLRFQCKDYKLIARSRFQPSKTYTLTTGLSNDKNCKASMKSARNSGCFCDDQTLKCLVTKKIEPKGVVCPSLFLCFAWEGETTGQMQVETVSKHYTRKACEKELTEMFAEDDE